MIATIDGAGSLERILRFHERYAQALVADVSDAQMALCPGPGHENHPAWTLGHLVTASDIIGQDVGLASELPPGWGELFLRLGPSDRRLPIADGGYPEKARLLEELRRQNDRVIARVASLDPSWLAACGEEWRLSRFFPGRYDTLLFMAACHASLHLGQLAAWRRAMGLPAAMALM